MDGDNDLDAVACSISDDKIAWYENIDGQGVFTVEHVINSTSNAPRALYTSDLDNDGDIDILSMSQNEESPLGTIFWQENLDGLGNFGPTLLINDELHAVRSVYAADLDNDGDNDVLFSDLAEDVIGWHENLTILGVEKPELATIAIYPNPTISQLYVKTPLSVSKIEVYTILSKLVTVATKNIIDVSSLIPATYVLKITLIDGSTSYKKFVKK